MYSSTRITQVKAHNQLMTELYPQEIKYSIANSTIYGANAIFPQVQLTATSTTVQELWTSSTTEAVTQLYQAYPHAKIAVLNFADYEQIAGGYLNGALAQEEAVCFDSTLYQVLKHFDNYYAWNREHLNSYLYLDRALYSPKIIFYQNSYLATADVITCAAPFYRKSSQLGVDYEDAPLAITQRMAFVKRLAETEEVDYLVLGAWGAGVFGFNPFDVAKLWKNIFNKNSTYYYTSSALPSCKFSTFSVKSLKFNIELVNSILNPKLAHFRTSDKYRHTNYSSTFHYPN